MRQTVQPLRPSSPLPQQSTRLSAIRQSAYKLQRSTSHRKDHSLERKPPIIIKPKLTPRHPSATPLWPSPRHQTALKPKSNALLFFETAETEVREDGKMMEEPYFRSETKAEAASEGENFMGEMGWKETQEIEESLTVIEQAVARIRQTGHFLSQTSQIRQVLIEMREALPEQAQLRPSLQQINRGAAVAPLCQFEMRRIQCLLEESHPSNMQSHLSSLMIENEASHQLQFLSLYDANQEAKMQLKDITNVGAAQSARKIGPASPFHSSAREENAVMLMDVDKGSSSHSNDRVFLKNIVKRANPAPSPHHSDSPGSEINFTPCNLFASSPSPDESDSKRQVLNQIIEMLNRKYNKNISLGIGKQRTL